MGLIRYFFRSDFCTRQNVFKSDLKNFQFGQFGVNLTSLDGLLTNRLVTPEVTSWSWLATPDPDVVVVLSNSSTRTAATLIADCSINSSLVITKHVPVHEWKINKTIAMMRGKSGNHRFLNMLRGNKVEQNPLTRIYRRASLVPAGYHQTSYQTFGETRR